MGTLLGLGEVTVDQCACSRIPSDTQIFFTQQNEENGSLRMNREGEVKTGVRTLLCSCHAMPNTEFVGYYNPSSLQSTNSKEKQSHSAY